MLTKFLAPCAGLLSPRRLTPQQEGFVLVGHDGPHHLNIAEGKPVLRSLKKFHGKPGSGAT